MSPFDEYLNSVYGTYEVCGIVFYASQVLKELDPIAYDCEQANFDDVGECSREG